MARRTVTESTEHVRQVVWFDDTDGLHVDMRVCLTCGAVIHPDFTDRHEMWHAGTSHAGPSILNLS